MPGIYVAKPAAVSVPDVPPGWDVDWPFCGVSGYDPDPFFPAPHPPGYEPDYSLAVFGTESIAYDGTASITGTFRDNSTYVTNEPDVIAWTATVSSSPSRSVNLRFSGDEDYASSISSVCVFGTYWGATPDIEFELTEEDAGGTVILTGKSAISGSYVGATLAIEVAAYFTVSITSSASNIQATPGTTYALVVLVLDEIVNSTGQRAIVTVQGNDSPVESVSVKQGTAPSEPVGVADSSITTATIDVELLANEVFDLNVTWYMQYGEGDFSISCEVTDSEGERVDYLDAALTLESLESWGNNEWISIDGATGEITILNSIP